MIRLALALALFLSGCTADTAHTASQSAAATDPCASSADVAACDNCLAHAPRGNANLPVCQTAPGPSGASCCATTQADGSCVATYFDGAHESTGPCAPIVNGMWSK